MGQITGKNDFLSRVNLRDLATLPTPAAGEHILVSSDNSMNANGQGNFDCYIMGDGATAATALELHKVNPEIENIEEELHSVTEKEAIATFVQGGFIKSDGTVGSNASFYYVDKLNIKDYKTLTICCRTISAAWNVLFDANNNILHKWQSTTSPYITEIDIENDYPTAVYLSLSNYNFSSPYINGVFVDRTPTKEKIANLQTEIQELSTDVSGIDSATKVRGYKFDFVRPSIGGYIKADGTLQASNSGAYCMDVDISNYTYLHIICETSSYYCVLKDANYNVIAAVKSTNNAVDFDILHDYPSAKYLCACSLDATIYLCVSGYYKGADMNSVFMNITDDFWIKLQRFSVITNTDGYMSNGRRLVSTSNYYFESFLLAVQEGYVVKYSGYALGQGVNYIYYDNNFNIISTVYGQDYSGGVNVTIPSGVSYVEFFSMSPTGGAYHKLQIQCDEIPDLASSSSAGTSIGNVLYGKSYVCGGDSTSSANVIHEVGEETGDGYTLVPYAERIALRNNMMFSNRARSGGTIYTTGTYLKEAINSSTDYLTCMFGGNESRGTVGEIDSEDTSTFCGAYNDLMRYCLTTNPKMKILLITPIFDYSGHDFIDAVIAIAKRWGCGYLNTYSDPHIPLTYQQAKSTDLGICAEAKSLRAAVMNVDGVHPTQAGADAFSTIVEAYMRML